MYFQSVFINTFVVIANMATKWQAFAVFFVALYLNSQCLLLLAGVAQDVYVFQHFLLTIINMQDFVHLHVHTQ